MRMDPKQLRIYAVTDKSWLKPGETLEQVVEELLKAGVTCDQLRDKTADDGLLLKEAETLNALCRQYEVPLIINDRPDIAKKAGAAGVHVGLSDMGIAEARKILGPEFIIGGSAHSPEEALAAEKAGADYLGCGAVFGSHTKADAGYLPKERLTAICGVIHIPAVAIGGITVENIHELAGTGIAGTALVSCLFGAEDKTAAVKQVDEALRDIM